MVEVYDIDQSDASTVTNISTRGFVDVGSAVMIGGFIVGGAGNASLPMLVRALGPTLTQFGVSSVQADPTLELHDANGTVIGFNDNWQDTQKAQIQASGLAPPNPVESAIIITRPPSNTTAIVRGKNNTTGNALVEVYTLTPGRLNRNTLCRGRIRPTGKPAKKPALFFRRNLNRSLAFNATFQERGIRAPVVASKAGLCRLAKWLGIAGPWLSD